MPRSPFSLLKAPSAFTFKNQWMGSWDIKRYLDILLEKFLSACVTAIVIMGVDCGDENNQSKPVPGPHAGGDWTQVAARASNEGYLKVLEDFTITEKAPTSAFTLKTLLRHYDKRALTPRSLST